MTSITSHTRSAVSRVRTIGRELGYAQRRMFELQTGVRLARPARHAINR